MDKHWQIEKEGIKAVHLRDFLLAGNGYGERGIWGS
jgi:hypothetical protein